MKHEYTLFILVSTLFVCSGFADCHYGAATAVYKLDKCPPKGFEWPSSVKSESLEAHREFSYKFPEDKSGIECHKLVRYSMRQGFKKNEWTTYNNYVAFLPGSSCHLIVSTYRIGPANYSEEREQKDAVKKTFVPFVQLIQDSLQIKIQFPEEKIELFDSKDNYIEWCKKLPIIQKEL